MPDRHDDSQRDQPRSGTPTAQELRAAIDSGDTKDKISFPDPAAAPLGTDDEAGGTPDAPTRVKTALRQELSSPSAPRRARPVSPNIQIYRPQITSVLSIGNRITGVCLSVGAVCLVAWLAAAASGPQAFGVAQDITSSWLGQFVLFGFTFAFFFHLCGGIRHLIWDTVHWFELRSIYVSGWSVVAASAILTIAAWAFSLSINGF